MNGVNELTNEIIGAAIEVHRTLGPGLLESTWKDYSSTSTSSNSRWASGASSMSFQNNLCDLRVLGGEYVTAIRARAGRHIGVLFTAETAEGAEMNGVNELTNEIIGAAIEVHRTLGPGLLESTYEGLLLNFNVKQLTMGIRRLVHELPE